jgi:putative DNA primase/helicase
MTTFQYPENSVAGHIEREEARKRERVNGGQEPEHPEGNRYEDAYIGAQLAKQYLKGSYIFARAFGWMKYDGRRWKDVGDEIVFNVLRKAVIELHRDRANGEADVAELRKIDGLLSTGRIRAIQTVAKSFLAVEAAEFDHQPDLMNVRNGVVDLRTGELKAHDPELMFTKVTPTDYIPGAGHPDWRKALEALPDDETRKWVQLRLGQGITGYPTPDDVMVVLKGSGENGKSTLIDGVRKALGKEYAPSVPNKVLLARPSDHPTELMTLRGARLAFMEEFPELGHLNVKRLKDLHGTEELNARYCGKDNVSWCATHTLMVTTNYEPKVDESDPGTWRRLAMVEFPYRFRKLHEQVEKGNDRPGDPNLRDRLRSGVEQHQAVLAWLVEGAVKWHRGGKHMGPQPKAVADATRRWRDDTDLLGRYLRERIKPDQDAHVMATELFADFSEWLKSNGHREWSNQVFGSRLIQHSEAAPGLDRKVIKRRKNISRGGGLEGLKPPPNSYTAWLGIRFREETDDLEENPDN